jgi:glycosyltransferase domain-containing protein
MTALLTVLIPTYNRPEQLARTVRFLQRHPAPFPIIIADGSDDEQASRNRHCRDLGNNILYFHAPLEPPEDTWKNYFRRTEKALDQINTPYAAFCADDDLLIPESAIESAAFLQDNPQYVACHGHYLQFEYTTDKIRIPNFEYQGPSIDADEVAGRLIQLFSRYEAPFYAVYRTAAMRVLMGRFQEPVPPLWPEIYHSTGAVIAGKIHRSETIYCLRNIGNPPHYRSGSTFRDFGQWVAADLDGFLAHYVKYRACVLEWVTPEADRGTVQRALDMAFITYIGSEFNPAYWIDRCCETVKDAEERDKLRSRLNQNLSRMTARTAPPSIRSAGLDLVRTVLGQTKLSLLRKGASTRLRAAIERTRWTRLRREAIGNPVTDRDCDYYGVDIRTSLLSRFPSEQWNFLTGIEKHD